MYRKSSLGKGLFTILSDLSEAYIQRHKLFCFHTERNPFSNIYVMKEERI